MKTYESNDVLTTYLSGLGIAVETYYLPGTRIILGGIFRHGDCRIAYRVEEETSTVILSYYKREEKKQGLKSSFADLLWFFDILAKPELNIKRVEGLVSPSIREAGGLSAARLEKFYKMLGASLVRKEGEDAEWIGSTPEKYRQWRAQHP